MPRSLVPGLSAFPVTPADAEGVVDTRHLQRLVSRLAGKVDSIGVLGSTGSYMYLAKTQRDRALTAAIEAAEGTPVLAGIGALTTVDVLHHAITAERVGAAGLLLAPVSYLPLTDDEFAILVQTVSKQVDLPIVLYNNPSTTGFSMSEDLVIRLSRIENVVGVKNPAPPSAELTSLQLTRLRAATPEGFVLGYSGDAAIAGPLEAGADSWFSVVAGTLPMFARALWDARQNADRLRILTELYAPLLDIFAKHGAIRIMPHILNRIGEGPYALPLPLQPLNDDLANMVDTVLDGLLPRLDAL